MTPQALFLYLSQTRHFTEDIAQEVVIVYLTQEGRVGSPKTWATTCARRLASRERDRHERMNHPLNPQQPSQGQDALTRVVQRQEIERHWPPDLRKV